MRRQIAAELFSTKFHENPSNVPRVVTNEEKERQTLQGQETHF